MWWYDNKRLSASATAAGLVGVEAAGRQVQSGCDGEAWDVDVSVSGARVIRCVSVTCPLSALVRRHMLGVTSPQLISLRPFLQ